MLGKHNASEPALHFNEIDVNDKYEFVEKIGQGSFGEVWLVLSRKMSTTKYHREQYVLKRLDLRRSIIKPSQNDIESAEREAKLLSTLEHPNIVAYKESFRSNDGYINIVMTYCEGGDLSKKINERALAREFLPENQVVEWFIQICMALRYIHERNILHRDLKNQNIFLTKHKIIKLGDFGIAKVLGSKDDFTMTTAGSPFYMSPEIVSRKPYGQKSDIWSLGCCMYEMMTFEHAFTARDMDSLALKIVVEKTPQISNRYSKPLVEIIKSMLEKNPDDRPTAKEILQKSYMKQQIIQLLKKREHKHQTRVTSKSQPISTVVLDSSSPPKHRHSSSNTSILPPHVSLSHHSHSRPSSSSSDVHRSTPPLKPMPSNESMMSNSKVDHGSPLTVHDPHETSSTNHRTTLFEPSQSHPRPNSVETSASSSRPPIHPQMTTSYDSNQGIVSTARQRRRDLKSQSTSSSVEYLVSNASPVKVTDEKPQSTSHDNLTAEMEKKKEGEKDMTNFISILNDTLRLPLINEPPAVQRKSRFYQRCEVLRDNCLREIKPEKLHHLIKLLEHVSDTRIMEEMINELGEELYQRYSSQIFLLKFYADNLSIHL